MKIKGSLEQAVCILLVIAHTKGHAPVKSYTLSERLGLSDSYLKKIMRQLVVAGLVDSEAGKKGGFVLKRAPKNISLLDVFEAIESTAPFLSTTNLVDKVFPKEKMIAHEKEQQNHLCFYPCRTGLQTKSLTIYTGSCSRRGSA